MWYDISFLEEGTKAHQSGSSESSLNIFNESFTRFSTYLRSPRGHFERVGSVEWNVYFLILHLDCLNKKHALLCR